MNGKYRLLIALIVLAFVVAGVFLVFLPEQVPAHYDISGNIDRFGSKYENLILPAFTLILGASFAVLAKRRGSKGDQISERIYLITGISVSALMILMSVFFLCKALAYSNDSMAAFAQADPMKLLAVGLGVFLGILGYIMPGVKMNRVFGLRTKWSMKNARVWAKCQRFGSTSAMICACLMALAGILLSGAAALIAVLALVIAWGIICTIVSRKIFEKDSQETHGDGKI